MKSSNPASSQSSNRSALLFASAVFSFAVILLWQVLFDEVSYYLICTAVLIIAILPVLFRFEKKSVTSGEIALMATMIALAVASRAAFYLIPQVKPIAAVVVVSAVCFGAERGYLIGAFSAFVSNFLFGQGYWTPYQMMALGLVGLLSGIIFRFVKVNRFTLAAVGFVLSTVLYGLIVDLSTIFAVYGNNITLKGVLSVYGAGAPFSLIFGLTTAAFLLIFGEAFIKKLDRINTKYEIIKGIDE